MAVTSTASMHVEFPPSGRFSNHPVVITSGTLGRLRLSVRWISFDLRDGSSRVPGDLRRGGPGTLRPSAFYVQAHSAAASRTTCHPRYARLVSSEGQQLPFGQNGQRPDRHEGLSLKFKTPHDKLPGTEDARKLGCTCRDPAHVLSKGAELRAGWLRDLVSDDCPLHEVVIVKDDA
jgi:hypothetical protein